VHALLERIDATSSALESFVAAWGLEKAVPLRYGTDRSDAAAFVLTYEELVLTPEGVLKALAEAVHLDDVDRMREQVSVPSVVTDSSTRRTKDRIREGDRRSLVRKWKRQVSEAEENDLFAILDAFDIDVYRAGRLLSQEHFLHDDKSRLQFTRRAGDH
jgi:hypothetical protein